MIVFLGEFGGLMRQKRQAINGYNTDITGQSSLTSEKSSLLLASMGRYWWGLVKKYLLKEDPSACPYKFDTDINARVTYVKWND